MTLSVAHRLAYQLKKNSHHPTFPLFVTFLLSLDFVVLIVPSTTIVLAACLLQPRRWWHMALGGALGAAVGGTGLAAVAVGASQWLFTNFPLDQTQNYLNLKEFIGNYGGWGLLAVAALPISVRTAIVVAAVGGLPMAHVFLAVVVGRSVAYGTLGALASRAPHHLLKIKTLAESPIFKVILEDNKSKS